MFKEVVCQFCGKAFVSRQNGQKFCSSNCRIKNYSAQQALKRSLNRPEEVYTAKSDGYKTAIFTHSDLTGHPHLEALFKEYGLTHTSQITGDIAREYCKKHKIKRSKL